MLSTLIHFPGRALHSSISGSRVAHLLRGCLAPVALAMILAGCDAGQSGVTPNATATARGASGLVTATSDAWTPLEQRALHLPTLAPGASCPVAQPRQVNPDFGAGIGPGPVYAAIGSSDGVLRYASAQSFRGGTSGWGGSKVLWYIDAKYTGPVLVRGHQIDGPHELRFDGGITSLGVASGILQPDMRMLGDPAYGTPWPNYPSYTRVQAPGCYAYQIDGNGFSQGIIFRAELQTP